MLLGIPLGVPEIAIILVIVLLLFGPTKLPQLGASVGKMLRGFKKEMKSLDEESSDEAEADADARPDIEVTPTKPSAESGSNA